MRQIYTPPGIYSERNIFCRYDSEIGWVPLPHFKGVCNGSRTVQIQQNALGFSRSRTRGQSQRPVLAVLGDSFVYGYDVEQNERFTERRADRKCLRGIYSTWGSVDTGRIKSIFLLRRYFDPLIHPDLVLLALLQQLDPDDNANE